MREDLAAVRGPLVPSSGVNWVYNGTSDSCVITSTSAPAVSTYTANALGIT